MKKEKKPETSGSVNGRPGFGNGRFGTQSAAPNLREIEEEKLPVGHVQSGQFLVVHGLRCRSQPIIVHLHRTHDHHHYWLFFFFWFFRLKTEFFWALNKHFHSLWPEKPIIWQILTLKPIILIDIYLETQIWTNFDPRTNLFE